MCSHSGQVDSKSGRKRYGEMADHPVKENTEDDRTTLSQELLHSSVGNSQEKVTSWECRMLTVCVRANETWERKQHNAQVRKHSCSNTCCAIVSL